MRLETLALERYGAFTDRLIAFRADAHVHVVHGPNEAGKTSALAALTDLLFGFPKRTAYNFEHESKALRIGATLRLADGSALGLRRRKGDINTFVDVQDRPLADDPLVPLLAATTRETFLAECGLTAQTLRLGGNELVKAGGRLAETLAASSAGLSALLRTRAAVEGEAEKLFDPKRRNASKEFYAAALRHQEADRRLREAIVTADAVKAAAAAVEAAVEEERTVKEAIETISRELELCERTRRTRPKLMAIRQDRADLEVFEGLAEVRADEIANWIAAIDEEYQLRNQIAELDAADAAGVTRIAALAIDEALLAAGHAIDDLRERRGAVAKARDDLPRRIGARRLALDNLDNAGRRLGLASPEAVLKNLPTDAAIARVRELIAAGKRATERLAEADGALADAQAEHERLAQRDVDLAPAVDTAPLKRRFAVLAEIPVDADRLRRERASLDLERKRLTEAAGALHPSLGSLDLAAALPLPEGDLIAEADRDARALAEEFRQGEREIAALEEQMIATEREIARLAAGGGVSTREDLAASRAERDAAIEVLRLSLDDAASAAERLMRFTVLNKAVGAADSVTDRLLSNLDRAVRRETAEAQLAAARQDRERHAAAQARLLAKRAAAETAWRDLWAAAGIVPLEPVHMVGWREQTSTLLDRRRRLDEREAEFAALAAKLNGLRQALHDLARDLRIGGAGPPQLEILYHETARDIEEAQSAWTEARTRANDRKAADRLVSQAQDRFEKARREQAAWAAVWPAAVAGVGLPPDVSVVEAEAALAVWQSVAIDRAAFERESQSVVGIERDLEDFENDVAALAAGAGAGLAGRRADEVLASLLQRLDVARKADNERRLLHDAGRQRQVKRAPLSARRVRAQANLADARSRLGLTDAADLHDVIGQLASRQQARERVAQRLSDLREVADGLDETMLWAEQAVVDLVELDLRIEALKGERTRLFGQAIGAAAARVQEARAALKVLEAGRNAEGAARDRAEAATELIDVAERWLVRAAAAKLATLAIDRHRAAVQDPLVARASGLFSTITGDAFAGLAMEFGERDVPVLVARRANGRNVPIEGLSEGTRDQLFLVLRLALLERRAIEPLPFVGDDLLASFDEPRTAQALDVLACFGRNRQVILFTHHAHVAEIARQRLGRHADVLIL